MPMNKYAEPEDTRDKHVYSLTKLLAPNSFMSETILKENMVAEAPPPTYDTYEHILEMLKSIIINMITL